jgi:hypothetical protein
MTKMGLRSLVLALMAMGLMGGSTIAYGQVQGEFDTIIADVPYSFIVGKTTLPQGKYEFRRVGEMGTAGNFVITDAKGVEKTIFAANPSSKTEPSQETAKNSELVFHVYGSEHHLSELIFTGEAGSYVVPNLKEPPEKHERVPATPKPKK